ncbi:MAG: di-trans,poly-cis-decaprenylcistransferase [Candidatus Aminicenantes bacterium RBG_16_63_14]|nr:MAG: di-trans,poly-cis-decaprenylcistransferase [Candidatus Aminicenantes bacterium RBG_16_63_14]OGD27998.1 MAG: di-trans,poly-cis-decaprenylcistransferase [Candidatus Aminicenantes bacterium RBG_19FT_COMBO_65_30]
MEKYLEDHFPPGTEEHKLLLEVDFDRLPRHIAVIMDGNGRWAEQRGLSRVEGHNAGSASVREIVETAARLGIGFLTLYAFSSENWKRPRHEVGRLWRLLREYLGKEDSLLVENDIRLRVIGRRQGIPRPVLRELERVEAMTRTNGRMTLVVALNYGGRDEIVDAARRIMEEGRIPPGGLDEKTFAAHLSTEGIPDPDLLVRTSGELRVSNFLLWQIAYTEIFVTPVLWPDFRSRHLLEAILEYQKRDRRFGDVRAAKKGTRGRT